MEFVELRICEKVGDILVSCNEEYGKDGFCLIYTWLASNTYKDILEGDVVLCSQAKSYIARVFYEENKELLKSANSNNRIKNEVVYWFGYLVTYWYLEYKEPITDIGKKYDITSILEAYEVLHSLSIKAAIDKIKEDYLI